MQALKQQGKVVYSDGSLKATGEQAIYATQEQTVLLTGSPRVVSGGMTTTADSMRLNRKTGDLRAEGNVKSTYSDLKPQPNGALLASADPIHVTALAVTAHKTPGTAVYSGGVRLWQQANVVEAPSIEFDREHRSIRAQALGAKKVTTTLVQVGNKGQTTPLTIVSGSLTYKDDDSKVHFGDGVVGRVDDIVLTAGEMDAYRQTGVWTLRYNPED